MPTTYERQRLEAVLDWAGLVASHELAEKLAGFDRWLTEEAVAAGGIGPNEVERSWERHVLDSLLFLRPIADCKSVLDVGSGVGLPGIPLAMARPDIRFVLLDRSRRRCDLARRAIRILELENVEVTQRDIVGYTEKHDCAVSRAALAPPELAVSLGGIASHLVVAGSRLHRPTPPPGWTTLEVPAAVLGEEVWLLEAWISGNSNG